MKQFEFEDDKFLNSNNKKFIEKDVKTLLDKNPRLNLFLEYLNKNKVNFKILGEVEDSYLIIKTSTIDPKYFIIIINKKDTKNYLLDYKNIKYFQKAFSNDKNNFANFYILFLDPSLNSIDDVLFKSSYVDFKRISLKTEFKRISNVDLKISLKRELRKGLPIGIYSEKNKLNDLTGKEWIKFTKSWFTHNPPPRNKIEILHPAKFPETLIEDFIKFFTKENQIVLDPFLGTGSTSVAAKNTIRSCIGVEINKNYAEIAKSRINQKKIDKWAYSDKENLMYKIINNDSSKLDEIWQKNKLPLVDFCITSPPYWNQLKRNFMRQEKRKEMGLDTVYSENPKDIGNIDDYREFINAQKKIFEEVYKVIKNKGYLVIITNNVFYNGRLFPLAHDTAVSLSEKWVLKDEKIWCQNDKALLPLGINNAWVANRCHQYCLIFRKEQN